MKAAFVCCVVFLFSANVRLPAEGNEEIKLECVKRQHSTKTCHYNFTIDGEPYRYIDNGCKSKKDDIVKKAKTGKLALAKDWKIECHVKKPKKE